MMRLRSTLAKRERAGASAGKALRPCLRSTLALVLLSCWAGARASAQTIVEAKRSNVTIPISGSIAFEDIAKLKSTFTGRVETLQAEEQTWVKAGKPLAYLADTKTAALLDYRGMTPKDVLLERWKSVYSLIAVSCPRDCLVMRRFVAEGQRLRPGDPLFQVAYRIALVGHVPPVYSEVVRDGQDLNYWPNSNPLKKRRTTVQNYVLAQDTSAGGAFTSFIEMRRYPEELQWSGRITLAKDILVVPTGSLVRYQGKVFLPLEVSIGIATEELTQVSAPGPLQEGNPVLVLDDAQLKQALKYDPSKIPLQPRSVKNSPQNTSVQKSGSQKKKPKGPSLWERLKNTKPLPAPGQERQSNSEDDDGD